MRVYKWLYIAEYLNTQMFPGREDEAVDIVMKHVDEMLLASDLQGVTDVLNLVAEHIGSEQVLLTLLTMTHRSPLYSVRGESAYQRVRQKLAGIYAYQGLSPDEIQNILVGL